MNMQTPNWFKQISSALLLQIDALAPHARQVVDLTIEELSCDPELSRLLPQATISHTHAGNLAILRAHSVDLLVANLPHLHADALPKFIEMSRMCLQDDGILILSTLDRPLTGPQARQHHWVLTDDFLAAIQDLEDLQIRQHTTELGVSIFYLSPHVLPKFIIELSDTPMQTTHPGELKQDDRQSEHMDEDEDEQELEHRHEQHHTPHHHMHTHHDMDEPKEQDQELEEEHEQEHEQEIENKQEQVEPEEIELEEQETEAPEAGEADELELEDPLAHTHGTHEHPWGHPPHDHDHGQHPHMHAHEELDNEIEGTEVEAPHPHPEHKHHFDDEGKNEFAHTEQSSLEQTPHPTPELRADVKQRAEFAKRELAANATKLQQLQQQITEHQNATAKIVAKMQAQPNPKLTATLKQHQATHKQTLKDYQTTHQTHQKIYQNFLALHQQHLANQLAPEHEYHKLVDHHKAINAAHQLEIEQQKSFSKSLQTLILKP